jgi:hypothetical protein
MINCSLNHLGFLRVVLIVLLTASISTFGFVHASSAGVGLPLLRLLGPYLVGKLLDVVLEKYVFKHGISEQLKQEIREQIERAIEKRSMQDINSELKEMIKQELKREISGELSQEIRLEVKEKLDSIAAEGEVRQELWCKVEGLAEELDGHLATSETTWEELFNRYDNLLDEWIKPLGVRVSDLEINVEVLKSMIEEVKREVDNLKVDVDGLKEELDSVKTELETVKNQFAIDAVLGYSYQAFRFSYSSLNERYSYVPFRADPKRIFSGIQVSFGLWFNRALYIEGNVHYMSGESERIPIDHVRYYRLGVEGVGWSGTGVLTVPVYRGLILEMGGGWVWSEYRVACREMPGDIKQDLTAENDPGKRLRDPLVVAGLRVGRKGLSFLSRVECLVRDQTVKGYYVRAGLQWIR